jgi:hypothetical protein
VTYLAGLVRVKSWCQKRWNTRRGTRTTPRYSPISTPDPTAAARHSSGRPRERRLGNGAPSRYPADRRGRTKNTHFGRARSDDKLEETPRRRSHRMRRRELVLLLSATITAPQALRAQQKAMPVIGYLNGTSPGPYAPFVGAFRQGLRETGYIEGQNVAIEYRWVEGRYDQLAALADGLVGCKVDVIAASGEIGTTLSRPALTPLSRSRHDSGWAPLLLPE